MRLAILNTVVAYRSREMASSYKSHETSRPSLKKIMAVNILHKGSRETLILAVDLTLCTGLNADSAALPVAVHG